MILKLEILIPEADEPTVRSAFNSAASAGETAFGTAKEYMTDIVQKQAQAQCDAIVASWPSDVKARRAALVDAMKNLSPDKLDAVESAIL